MSLLLRLVPLPPSLAESLPKPLAAGIGLAAELPAAMVKIPQLLVMKGLELAGRYDELARTGAELVAGASRDEGAEDVDEFADYPSIEGWGSTALHAVGEPVTQPVAEDAPVPAALAGDPAAAPLVRAAEDRAAEPAVVPDRQDLPIADYDSLSAAALRAKVGALSAAELASVRDYEAAHAKRLTVLQLLERKIAAAR